ALQNLAAILLALQRILEQFANVVRVIHQTISSSCSRVAWLRSQRPVPTQYVQPEWPVFHRHQHECRKLYWDLGRLRRVERRGKGRVVKPSVKLLAIVIAVGECHSIQAPRL